MFDRQFMRKHPTFTWINSRWVNKDNLGIAQRYLLWIGWWFLLQSRDLYFLYLKGNLNKAINRLYWKAAEKITFTLQPHRLTDNTLTDLRTYEQTVDYKVDSVLRFFCLLHILLCICLERFRMWRWKNGQVRLRKKKISLLEKPFIGH